VSGDRWPLSCLPLAPPTLGTFIVQACQNSARERKQNDHLAEVVSDSDDQVNGFAKVPITGVPTESKSALLQHGVGGTAESDSRPIPSGGAPSSSGIASRFDLLVSLAGAHDDTSQVTLPIIRGIASNVSVSSPDIFPTTCHRLQRGLSCYSGSLSTTTSSSPKRAKAIRTLLAPSRTIRCGNPRRLPIRLALISLT
jgi:hypothetical protein